MSLVGFYEKLGEQALPGAPYVEQYFQDLHRRNVSVHTLKSAFTTIQSFLAFLQNRGKIPPLFSHPRRPGSLCEVPAGPRIKTAIGQEQSAASPDVSSVLDRRGNRFFRCPGPADSDQGAGCFTAGDGSPGCEATAFRHSEHPRSGHDLGVIADRHEDWGTLTDQGQ